MNAHIDASKPEEWDDEEDGDYIPPTIPNPKCDAVSGCGEWKRYVLTGVGEERIPYLNFSPYKANPDYKGKWYAPLIPNPAYKGPWAPRQIPNPAYFEDKTPIKSLPQIVSRSPGVLSKS